MPYAPERLINTLAELLAAQNEKHLSRLLHISPAVIQGIRSGTVRVTPTLLQQMAERTDSNMDTLRVILGDRRQKARMPMRPTPAARPVVPLEAGRQIAGAQLLAPLKGRIISTGGR